MLIRTVKHLHTGEEHLVPDETPTVDVLNNWNKGVVFSRRTWRDDQGRTWAEIESRGVAEFLWLSHRRVRPVAERVIGEPCLVSGTTDVAPDGARMYWPCTVVA